MDDRYGKKKLPVSKTQYFIYLLMLIYSLANILFIATGYMWRKTEYLWAVNLGCVVLTDLCLFYLIKTLNKKDCYKKQVCALERQVKMQYEYYFTQNEKYNATLRILHDVNKHIKSIEELFLTENGELAVEYTKQIKDLLQHLIPTKFSGNPVLDILLTDKVKDMNKKGIEFQSDIENVDLRGIEPIDITTIFGNLLDNAIEASEKSKDHKLIYVKINGYHQMISVKIENNSDYVKWKDKIPVSEKGKDRGLGILNVQRSVEKYDGNIKLSWKDNKFIVEMLLNI